WIDLLYGFASFFAVSLRLPDQVLFGPRLRLNQWTIAHRKQCGGTASEKKAPSGRPKAYRKESGRAANARGSFKAEMVPQNINRHS
ncbi:MAG: hypothetical protein ABR501_13660, partial [Pyrinomonadaceae bacterium]